MSFLSACTIAFLVGACAAAFDVWRIADSNEPTVMGAGGGLIGGSILMGLATFEFVRRLRHGPQPAGRHSTTRPQRPTDAEIRSVARALLELTEFAGRDALLAQVDRLEYVDGIPTMLDLRVVGPCLAATGVPSPVPIRPTVIDADGRPVGALLLWLDDAGYIDRLEFYWHGEERPERLPPPQALVL